jgi:hypothetical protein
MAAILGKHGNGVVEVDLTFPAVPVGDDENAVFAYVLNNDGQDSDAAVSKVVAAAVALADGGTLAVPNLPVVGTNCDGPLAAGSHAFSGAEICSVSGGYQGTDQDKGYPDQTILGIPASILCSTTTSLYNVSWSVS